MGELEAAETIARFFNMIGATVDSVTLTYPEVRRVGILSTAGARLAGLYSTECYRRGLFAIELDEREQVRLVDPAISAVKAGLPLDMPRRQVQQAVENLAKRGAELVIAGCTEIPLISSEAAGVLPVIDATECLASAIVAYALSAPCGDHGTSDTFPTHQ